MLNKETKSHTCGANIIRHFFIGTITPTGIRLHFIITMQSNMYILQLTPLKDNLQIEIQFDGDVTAYTYGKYARTEPTMELYGPYTAQMAWKVYRAIDWTHMHHEQTYDSPEKLLK